MEQKRWIYYELFCKSHINIFNNEQLKELENFLKFEDETISKLLLIMTLRMAKLKIIISLKYSKILKSSGGEGGI